MAKQYWLMKSEPDVYSYDDLVAEGEGRWDGVRNHSAAINLRSMKLGDEAFFYHSNIGLEIVAIMTISQEYFIDPTDEKARFVAVKVKPSRKLKQPVTLKAIKANPKLAEMEMLRQSRLSVAPVRPAEWKEILKMAGE
ncbi:EVE domain-containing protein [Sphingorhabdus sp.]|uniref:EVE domain-containing protein n=1 Tax=Sphingorhabdus sp. TaxID=1902408 RepID=UPI0039839F6E